MQTRHILTAAAVAAMAFTASAAEVQIYGLIDTGLNFQSIDKDTAGSDTEYKGQLKGSQLVPNRFGFRGSEDLGDGLKVSFMLEGQFGSDDGSLTSGRMFHRVAQLALESDTFGTLTFGRSGILRSGFGTTGIWGPKTNPFSNSAGDFIVGHKYIMPGDFKSADNVITWKSPKMAGAQLHLQYSSNMDGQNNGNVREFENQADRMWAVGLTYGNGPLNIVSVLDSKMYQKGELKNTPDASLAFSLEADYDFQVVKVYAAGMYFRDVQGRDFQGHDVLGSLKTSKTNDIGYDGYSLELGADVPLAGGTFKANIGWMDAEGAHEDGLDTDRLALAVGYVYPLSKRTQFYTAAGYVRDSSNINKDSNPSAYEVLTGLVHRF